MFSRRARPASKPKAAQRAVGVEAREQPAQAAAERPRSGFTDLAIHPPRSNRTGLPDRLKSGIESLSGVSMDGVRVHYNSARPKKLGAHAIAQGREIHLAPGQAHHLPHEAWHIVQQAQGRVRPTMKARTGEGINDDRGLESEADAMGAKAARFQGRTAPVQDKQAPGPAPSGLPAQRVPDAKWDPEAAATLEKDRRKTVGKLAPERLTGLKGKLEKSAHTSELEALTQEQDQLVATTLQNKTTLQEGMKEFMASGATGEQKKARVEASKQATKDYTAAVATRTQKIEAKKNLQSGLKNSASMSWVDRHKAVAKAAKAADPLMHSLLSGTGLTATHERNADARNQEGTLKGTRTFGPDGAKMASGSPLSIVGADEFQNKPDSADRGAPILPVLTKSGTDSRKSGDAFKSTKGAWGEADVNRLMGKERDAVRLLHTSPKSKGSSNQKNPVKNKPAPAEKLEHPFYLSVDHYESAIPISPLKGGYKRQREPLYDASKGRPNPLQQEELEKQREKEREANRQKLKARIGALKAARGRK